MVKKRNIRPRRLSKNKTKKVRHWWYNKLSSTVDMQSMYSMPIGSLTLWFKLKTSKWYNITIVKKDDFITTYVDGIKE